MANFIKFFKSINLKKRGYGHNKVICNYLLSYKSTTILIEKSYGMREQMPLFSGIRFSVISVNKCALTLRNKEK